MQRNGDDSGADKRVRPPMANPAIGAGMTLAVTVGLSAFGGIWLDQQCGTKPWLMLLLVLSGIVGSMLHLIRVAAPDMWPFGDLKQAALKQDQKKAEAARAKAFKKNAVQKSDSSRTTP
jgi:F0F1-type ATP synthase assembly protein I